MTELLANVGLVIGFIIDSFELILNELVANPVLLLPIAMGVGVMLLYKVKSLFHA